MQSVMESTERDFWLYPLRYADESWVESVCGSAHSHWSARKRIEGRLNSHAIETLKLGFPNKPIACDTTRIMALQDHAFLKPIARRASYCLLNRQISRVVNRDRKRWVKDVFGDDLAMLSRRAPLLWRDESVIPIANIDSLESFKAFLDAVGLSAIHAVAKTNENEATANRILMKFPHSLSQKPLPDLGAKVASLHRLLKAMVTMRLKEVG